MSKYTFLVPAYKPEFLTESLGSICSQTFDDFCIVVSDDCSPYNLHGIIFPFIEKYGEKKITYRRNTVNIGGENLVKHWNKLIGECDSQYLIMASDDDVYNPHFLEEVERLITYHPNVDVIRTRVQRINYNGEITGKEDIFEEYQNWLEAEHSIFCGHYFGCIGNYVFRTNALKNIGGFVNLPYAWFSDLLTVVSLLGKGQVNSYDILFSFRLSGINISDTNKKAVDRKKLDATIDYDAIISQHMSQKKIPSNPYEQTIRTETIRSFKHRAYIQTGYYSWTIPIWQWYRIYEQMKTHPYFSTDSFLKYFCECVFNRWFAKFAAKIK